MQTTKTTNPRAVGRRKSDVKSARDDMKGSKQYRGKKEKRLKAKRRRVDI